MRNHKRNKKRFWKPVAAGFGAMYLLTMGLATYLVKEKFVEDYGRQFEAAAASISRKASQREFDMEDEEWEREERKGFYQSLADESHWAVPGGAFEISVAFYDQEKNLMAKSREQAGGSFVRTAENGGGRYVSFGLDDYLTQEEKEELAKYNWEDIRANQDYYTTPNPWRFCIRTSPDENQLWGIYVQQITWQEEKDWNGQWYTDPLTGSRYSMESGVKVDYGTGEEMSEGKTYYETDSRVMWQWMNPDVDERTQKEGKIFDTGMTFPYMGSYEKGSFERWKRWSTSPFLHDYPDKGEFTWELGLEEPPLKVVSDGLIYRAGYQLQLGMAGEPFSYMEIRMESRPWLDALDYMKYVCLAGLMLTMACTFKIVFAFGKVYDRQKALEETRRNFTNAMAHELKTPLGIIRNFAENLLEHNMEEKRDYYLEQIIGQTEEMDGLVLKMIEVSKLDSEELVLKKEQVSFGELVREQMERLEPVIREKGIRVEYKEDGDFVAEGDKEYLAKAIWNLLANAVDYNVTMGRILVRTGRDECVIENSGEAMGEEDSGDKSRSRREKHMGIGLFLAKKILGLHGLELTAENIDDGVRVAIRRE